MIGGSPQLTFGMCVTAARDLIYNDEFFVKAFKRDLPWIANWPPLLKHTYAFCLIASPYGNVYDRVPTITNLLLHAGGLPSLQMTEDAMNPGSLATFFFDDDDGIGIPPAVAAIKRDGRQTAEILALARTLVDDGQFDPYDQDVLSTASFVWSRWDQPFTLEFERQLYRMLWDAGGKYAWGLYAPEYIRSWHGDPATRTTTPRGPDATNQLEWDRNAAIKRLNWDKRLWKERYRMRLV